jgi:solute carrier family 25 carnitine/acylcarnitine transporter 20/29
MYCVQAPIDLVKTKLQVQIFVAKTVVCVSGNSSRVQGPVYSTVRGCVSYVVRTHGVAALWQGWTSTLIRNVPANALFFPVNELVKLELARRYHKSPSELDLHHRLIAGACAGLSYWTLTYPLDVVKGRMQGTPYEQRQSWRSTLRDILRTDGPAGFFRGFAPCAARAVPACAALFATTDIVRYELQGSDAMRRRAQL